MERDLFFSFYLFSIVFRVVIDRIMNSITHVTLNLWKYIHFFIVSLGILFIFSIMFFEKVNKNVSYIWECIKREYINLRYIIKEFKFILSGKTFSNILILIFVFVFIQFSGLFYNSFKKLNNERLRLIGLNYNEKYENGLRLSRLEKYVVETSETNGIGGTSLKPILEDMKNGDLMDIDKRIEDLPIEFQEKYIKQLIDQHGIQNYSIFNPIFRFPVSENSYISSEFNYRKEMEIDENGVWKYVKEIKVINGVEKEVYVYEFHPALDICVQDSVQVFNIADGIVIEVGKDIQLGNFLRVLYEINGIKYIARYGHLDEIFVKEKEKVKMDQVVSKIGRSGKNTTGKHLDFCLMKFENNRWVYINPVLNNTYNLKYYSAYYYNEKLKKNILFS